MDLDSLQDHIHELFDYNRENYMFDQEQNIERQYQEQDMRVKAFTLYREDVRDLVELTTGKMDSYILPILFELGLCFLMLVHGALDRDLERGRLVPTWLLWLYTINLAEAFLYLFMAAWLAAHASVCAHAFGVRLLTQFVRLPVPSKTQLDAARRYASEFENPSTGILRIPLVQQQLAKRRAAQAVAGIESDRSVASSSPPSDVGTDSYMQDGPEGALARMQFLNPTKTMPHITEYRKLQANWQAHDAYCRACIALGTYTLVHALSYFLVAYLVVMLDAVGPALCCAIMLSSLAWLLLKLDLLFRRSVFVFVAFLVMSGPILAVVALTLVRSAWPKYIRDIHWYIVPAIYLLQALVIVCIGYVARGEQLHSSGSSGGASNPDSGGASITNQVVALPTKFRTVLYLDVFGWAGEESDAREEQQQQQQQQPGLSGERFPFFPLRRRHSRDVETLKVKMPEHVKRDLLEKCKASAAKARHELQAWESDHVMVRETIEKIEGLGDEVDRLRDRYDDIMRVLIGIQSDTMESTRSDDVSNSFEEQMIWLKFLWHDQEFYVNSVTGETKSSAQAPSDAMVSEIDSLHMCLERLRTHALRLENSSTTTSQPPTRGFVAPTDDSLTTGVPRTDDSLTTGGGCPSSAYHYFHSSVSSPGLPSGSNPFRRTSPTPSIDDSGIRSRANAIPPTTTSFQGSEASSRSRGRSPPAGGWSSVSESVRSVPLLAEDRTAGPAQEIDFGGREASYYRQSYRQAGSQVFGTQSDPQPTRNIAQTFHPREDGRRESTTPPGQQPWTSFKRSSCLLILIWAIGVLWYGIEPWVFNDFRDYDGDDKHGPSMRSKHASPEIPVLTGAHLALIASSLPGRPLAFRAVGLSCESAMSDRMLVADEYAVFRVQLPTLEANEETPISTIDKDIQNCFEARPEFRNAGLAGISMECRSDGHCDALLLGTGGAQLLRCPLTDKEAQDAKRSTVVSLKGSTGQRSWSSIVSSKGSQSGKKYWWGLPSGSLRPQRLYLQHIKGLGPHAFTIPGDRIHWKSQADAKNQSSMRGAVGTEAGTYALGSMSAQYLHSHDGVALLGLLESDSGSSIQAWSVDGRRSSKPTDLPNPTYLGSWRLPEGLVWNSMCSAGNKLYIAGARRGARVSEIWRFDLPSPVVSLSKAHVATFFESENDTLTV